MRTFDWMVVIVAAIVGWMLVNYLFSRGKPDDKDEDGAGERSEANATRGHEDPDVRRLPTPGRVPDRSPTYSPAADRASTRNAEAEDSSGAALSLEELGRHWHVILGVSSDATVAQIERAYHSKIAEYDAIRFSSEAPDSIKRRAEEHRERVSQAFEFIRRLR